MTDAGLVGGLGTVLVRMTKDGGCARLALDADRERFTALLSTIEGRPVLADDAISHVEAAWSHWQRGDKALATCVSSSPACRRPAIRSALAACASLSISWITLQA